MAYVLTNGAFTVVTYPYTVGMLRRDNQNVIFPAVVSDADLAAFNVYPVTLMTPPSYNVITQNLVELDPLPTSGGWAQQWSVVSASAQEIADRTQNYESAANAEAMRRLTESEGYWIAAFENGMGLHPDFTAYRAALIDVTNLPGYPVDPQWPTFPTNIYDTSKPLPIDVPSTTGFTMSGEIDMGYNSIVALPDPVNPQDAVHKQYVDDAIAGVSGGGGSSLGYAVYTLPNSVTLTASTNTTLVLNAATGGIPFILADSANMGWYKNAGTDPIILLVTWQFGVSASSGTGLLRVWVEDGSGNRYASGGIAGALTEAGLSSSGIIRLMPDQRIALRARHQATNLTTYGGLGALPTKLEMVKIG